MAEGGNSFYEHSSGQRPSISSSGDPPILDGSFLLQLLQRKPHGTSATSSSSQSLRQYQVSADAGFPLLPHSLLSPPKLSPASSQPGLHFGESLPLSPPSRAPHHFSPPDGGNQHLPGGQQFFHMDLKGLGFPQGGVSPPNFPPLNSNHGRIFPRSHHDGVLSSNQVGNLGGKVSNHRAQEDRASARPPPGFGKDVFDGPAEFNRKVEGGTHSRPEWRPTHYDGGGNSTFKMMDKSHLHNAIAERHNEKHNSGKILDGVSQYGRSDGFTNYKEKQTYSDFSGIPILNKCDFMGEKADEKFDRNLEDYDVEKQANRFLEEALHVEIGEVSSTKVTSIEEDLLCKQLTSALRDSLECFKVTKLINSRDKAKSRRVKTILSECSPYQYRTSAVSRFLPGVYSFVDSDGPTFSSYLAVGPSN
ncbi:hypothetical protein KSP40_PGU022078 [Platanthera guangdongensis]|uniref:Uncharacterized protein n=1 Tax=Platanthera guangdongensis TaxID=2320717 RepID=A0ABR2ML64_9ASPA